MRSGSRRGLSISALAGGPSTRSSGPGPRGRRDVICLICTEVRKPGLRSRPAARAGAHRVAWGDRSRAADAPATRGATFTEVEVGRRVFAAGLLVRAAVVAIIDCWPRRRATQRVNRALNSVEAERCGKSRQPRRVRYSASVSGGTPPPQTGGIADRSARRRHEPSSAPHRALLVERRGAAGGTSGRQAPAPAR